MQHNKISGFEMKSKYMKPDYDSKESCPLPEVKRKEYSREIDPRYTSGHLPGTPVGNHSYDVGNDIIREYVAPPPPDYFDRKFEPSIDSRVRIRSSEDKKDESTSSSQSEW